MKAWIIALALVTTTANATKEMVFIDHRGSLTLTLEPCSKSILESFIKEEYRDRFRRAYEDYGPSHNEACWTLLTPSDQPAGVFLVYEDGRQGMLAARLFKSKGI